MVKQKPEGMIAEFENPAALLRAAEKMRAAGFSSFDCHSPFPIHGMDRAMGEKRSPLGWIVAVVAFLGFSAGMGLEWWSSSVAYPLVISGKPFFSYQAFGPVAFAVMVLSSALTALIGMLALNKLPLFNHPVFNSDNFRRATDDAFFISILAEDPKYDEQATRNFLSEIGGQNIEQLLETTEMKEGA